MFFANFLGDVRNPIRGLGWAKKWSKLFSFGKKENHLDRSTDFFQATDERLRRLACCANIIKDEDLLPAKEIHVDMCITEHIFRPQRGITVFLSAMAIDCNVIEAIDSADAFAENFRKPTVSANGCALTTCRNESNNSC